MKTRSETGHVGAFEVDGTVTVTIGSPDQYAYADMDRDGLDHLIAKLQRVRAGMDDGPA